MHRRSLLLTILGLLVTAGFIIAAEQSVHKLSRIKELPEGFSEKVAAQLDSSGYRVAGGEGPVLDLWFAKGIAVKSGFAPGFRVNYPFKPGQLIGALRIPEGAEFSDFRGQEMKPGLYTLRYDQQPQDGNHIGTSDTADFLLALPAKEDTDPEPITNTDQLAQLSAKSTGTNHPAIFYLLPPEGEAPEQAALSQDEETGFWVLETTGQGEKEGETVKVHLKLVTIGQTEA